jgi:hypothetical protein
MMQLFGMVLEFSRHQFWLAQAIAAPPSSQVGVDPSALAFLSGSQFFIALIAGVVMAFAFQFLLTNFSIATDVSAGDFLFDTDAKGLGRKIRKFEIKVGVGTLCIVNTAIFIACFLAVKLTLIQSAMLAAIVSVVIWSVYFLVLLWGGSRAIASVVGSAGSVAGAGLQGVFGTVAMALSGQAANAQIVNTVEASVAAVTKDLQSAIAPDNLRESVTSYISDLSIPNLNLDTIGRGFEALLKTADLGAIADSDLLKNVNRETFVNLISSRSDFSQQEVEQIADRLETVWNRAVGKGGQANPQADLLDFIRTASPDELRSGQLRDRVQQLLGTNQDQSNPNMNNQALQMGFGVLASALGAGKVADQLDTAWNLAFAGMQPQQRDTLMNLLKGVTPDELRTGKLSDRLQQLLSNPQRSTGSPIASRALQVGFDSLTAALADRIDLSDLDVENIAGQLNSLRQQFGEQAGKLAEGLQQSQAFSTIRTDIENYLLNSPPWYLNPESIDRGFREVIYDPEADPRMIRQQLEPLNRRYFIDVLTRREGIAAEQVEGIADLLEVVRQEVLTTVRAAEEQENSQDLRHRVETYLRSAPKEELTNDSIQSAFSGLLVDPAASYETLGNRLVQFDRDTLMQLLLAGRQDLSQEEAEQVINQLEGVRDRFLNESQENWNRLQSEAAELQQQVEIYLRETNPTELTPEAIQRNLRILLDDPQAAISDLQTRLAHLNRDSLVQLLSQRGDLSEEQINRTIDQIEGVRDSILHAPQQLTDQAREQSDRLANQIADYLRNTNLEELNPEGIQQDLVTLLNDPQAGADALRSRLTQVDRETLVKLLSQRGDLTEEQVNRRIDQVQEAIQNIVKTPRRLAIRTRDRLRDFPSDVADYLRNTQKEELNPQGIQRDLQLLLKQPRAGLEQLSDRVSHFDRSTLVALLSQREDISEEEANQIADQIVSVRDQIVEQLKDAQQRVQSLFDSLFDRVRNYLNGLNRPELNYEGIQQDLQKLFDDPEAGAEALRDRLSQFDRETLVALLSSRSDVSEADAERIVSQIESVRDKVLDRAERLQAATEKRIKALKHQAKEQAEDIQKAVALAAWWLFGTALTSVATAAIAGVLAAGGFTRLPFGL